MQSAAKKLKGELSTALAEVQRLRDEESRILDARQAAHARLHRLEKVREKLRSKEHSLREQGMQELEAAEAKEKNSSEAESLAAQVAHPSPLADSFDFDPSFSMLPDVIFDNTPVPFS